MCPHNVCNNAVEQVRDRNVCSCRIKPGLAVESQQAAATLLLQQGWLHYSQAQQHTAGGAVNAAAEAGQAALACFQKAASCIHSFGETCSYVCYQASPMSQSKQKCPHIYANPSVQPWHHAQAALCTQRVVLNPVTQLQ